jgi:hypothetical protein
MRNFLFFIGVLLLSNVAVSQITGNGYASLKWKSSKKSISGLINCSSNSNGLDFDYCELNSKDSLFLQKFKYSFVNLRFYKNQLAEIHFDFPSQNTANLIAFVTEELGNPTVLEKKNKAADDFEFSIGYKWVVAGTEVLIINDGPRNPALCIISSKAIKATYPSTILNIEKLIFE